MPDDLRGLLYQWPVARRSRSFRAYVVEPAAHNPQRHTGVFQKVIEHLVTYHGSGARRFDLVVFPELFLPYDAVVETLKDLRKLSNPIGCVHTGLRPKASELDRHWVKITEARELIAALRGLRADEGDLTKFEQWLNDEEAVDSTSVFNLGLLFTIDANSCIRVSVHPKMTPATAEIPGGMKPGNLLSLITLLPEDRSSSTVTIQPLICADVLELSNDNIGTSPIDAANLRARCFPTCPPDRVDIVSVPAWTEVLTTGRREYFDGPQYKSSTVKWKMEFRRRFVASAERDDMFRHNHAVFIMSNYLKSPRREQGGLSGMFMPRSQLEIPTPDRLTTLTYARPPSGTRRFLEEREIWLGDEVDWFGDELRYQVKVMRQREECNDKFHEPVEWSALANMLMLDPRFSCVENDAVATIFGFTMRRLPHDVDSWTIRRDGLVHDCQTCVVRLSQDAMAVECNKAV